MLIDKTIIQKIFEDATKKIVEKDILEVDFKTGMIKNKTKNEFFEAKPFSKSQMDIYSRGGLLNKK